MNRKFILNADDFGMSKAYNKAVFEAYNFGILKSASLCANGESFDEAINEIIPKCQNLSTGVHLNIIEGKSLTNAPLLTDENGNFNNGYVSMIIKSFNKDFMQEVEAEFRAQIEKIQAHDDCAGFPDSGGVSLGYFCSFGLFWAISGHRFYNIV